MMKSKFNFILVFLAIVSCQSDIGKISNATKSVVFPGVPQAKQFVLYQAEVELFKPVNIVSVSVKNDQKEVVFDEFSLIQIPDGKIMNSKNDIPKGKYHFEARLYDMTNFEKSSDELIIQMDSNGNNKTFKIKVTDTPPIMRK